MKAINVCIIIILFFLFIVVIKLQNRQRDQLNLIRECVVTDSLVVEAIKSINKSIAVDTMRNLK